MAEIYITRHGQTEWNIEGRMQGRRDSLLTSLGEKQAYMLGKRLAHIPFSSIVTSSSGRTKQTAEWIRGKRPIPIVEKDHWQEIDLGAWEGLRKETIREKYTVDFDHFWQRPCLYDPVTGESFNDVVRRAGEGIEKLAAKAGDQPILLVTHAVVLKALMSYIQEKPLEDFWSGAFMHPTSLTIVRKEGAKWEVDLEGDTSHHDFLKTEGSNV